MPQNPLPAATPYTSADVPKFDAASSPGGMMGKLQMLQSLMPQQQEQEQGPQKRAPLQTGPSDPMQRRMAEMQQNPQMQIADSLDSLKFIDPSLRQDLAGPLLQAQMKAKQGV